MGTDVDPAAVGAFPNLRSDPAGLDRRLEVRILEMVACGSPLPDILDALSRLVEQIFTGSSCSILVVAADRKHFRVGAGPSLPAAYNDILDGKSIDGGYGPCSLAVIEKAPVITADLASDSKWEGSAWLPLMRQYGYASCWSMPILDGAGETSGIFAIYRREPVGPSREDQELVDRFTKIAEIAINRAQADEALQTSERESRRAHAQLAEAQRISKTGSFTWDVLADDHDWSDEIRRIFGFDQDVTVALPLILPVIHPDDMAEVERVLGGAFEGRDFDMMFRIRPAEGGLRHAHVVGHRVGHITDRPVFVGAIRDVTESKLAEAELQRANSYLTSAQRLSRTGSFTWDVRGRSSIWSDEMYRIFELAPGTPPNPEVPKIVHPDDMPIVNSLLRQALRGESIDVEYRLITVSGALKYTHTVAHCVEWIDGRPIFVGALQDVTDRKVAEDGLDRARRELAHVSRVNALSALTASIAHEVNQPLAGIVTNASTSLRMLTANPPNIEGAKTTAQRTIRDANRAADVIKRLRALFARRPPGSAPVDLNDAAREVLALSSGELQAGRVVLRAEFAAGLPHVPGDRLQLQQVVLNLVVNAAQAMRGVDDRPRELCISTADDGEGQVRLYVRDCGVGADVEHLEQLFSAFFTTKPDGMGVGLSVSRSIVEAHGGRLWARANDGPGLTVAFSVPTHATASLRASDSLE